VDKTAVISAMNKVAQLSNKTIVNKSNLSCNWIIARPNLLHNKHYTFPSQYLDSV